MKTYKIQKKGWIYEIAKNSKYQKLVVAGNMGTLREYENCLTRVNASKNNPLGRSLVATAENKRANRKNTLGKARTEVHNIVNANYTGKDLFITLTFGENVQDIPTANHHFDKFMKRISRYLGSRPKYIAVLEFQQRGAIHYHGVFFGVDRIENKELRRMWEKGFVRVERAGKVPQAEIRNLGAYLAKYMTADIADKRLEGHKLYMCSKGLNRGKVYTNKQKISDWCEKAVCVKTGSYLTARGELVKYANLEMPPVAKEIATATAPAGNVAVCIAQTNTHKKALQALRIRCSINHPFIGKLPRIKLVSQRTAYEGSGESLSPVL